jgi:hypothetical protein
VVVVKEIILKKKTTSSHHLHITFNLSLPLAITSHTCPQLEIYPPLLTTFISSEAINIVTTTTIQKKKKKEGYLLNQSFRDIAFLIPVFRAISFPEVTKLIGRLPLSTLFH